jgi:Uri superfamily endonuclease
MNTDANARFVSVFIRVDLWLNIVSFSCREEIASRSFVRIRVIRGFSSSTCACRGSFGFQINNHEWHEYARI